jgi:hypothetical protein
MAVAGAKITVEFPELEKLRAGIRNLGDKAAAAELLGDALYKSVYPAFLRLGEVTPIGPTRNLRRAVALKIKKYPRKGEAVALFGYRRAAKEKATSAAGGDVKAGPDRAFHQWWLEFGTNDRPLKQSPKMRRYDRRSPTVPFTRVRNGREETVRGKGVLHSVTEKTPTYIASSWNKLGQFKFEKAGNGRVQTTPGYPNAFFKKSKDPIVIPAMPAGGTSGKPPVQTAWNQTKGVVAERLQRELRLSLENAVKALVYRDTGSITGAITQAGG